MLRLLAALLVPLTAIAAPDPLKAFPAAAEGFSRHVLTLPAKPDESALRIELILGKTVEVDGVNSHFFGGLIEERVLEGMGFNYYHLEELGPLAGTLMAPLPDAPKVNRFVAIGGEPYLIRYNSKLPLVVYAPMDVQVRYRVWSAPPSSRPVPKG